ncbi:hypothetical protein [Streptomyces sp. NPDC048489]|uniref:hypothetical protein n=1 Tax=Streptomyces sp. NPDC048489 TaxID=3154504 RepID=UPI003429BFF8
MADKIRLTVVIEYEPDLRDYHGCNDVHEAAELEARLNPFEEFADIYLDDVVSTTFEGIPSPQTN